MTDILFVNSSEQITTYQHLAENLTALEPPLFCRLLASYMHGKGASVAIADCQDPKVDYLGFILDLKPRLVVIVAHGNQPSASTQTMPAVIQISKIVKEFSQEIPVLIVGGHPAALPERTLRETGADAVCTGEGSITTWQLLQHIKTNPKTWKYFLYAIDGLCYWDHDEIVWVWSNPAANLTDMRGMPGDCWDLLPMNLYRAHNWHTLGMKSRQPYASIQTSWGCPFSCGFCMIQSQFREGDNLKFNGKANSYRLWPVECVLTEIETLVEEYGITNIKIADEMFWLNPKHVLSICDGIIKRGWGDVLNVWCYSRIDSVKDEFLEKSRRAGIRWVALGIEALSDQVRDGVDKANYGEEDIYRTVKKIREHGINVIGNYIFGLPTDTIESMQATLNLALELKTEFANFYSMVCFPGSPLYSQMTAKGWKPPPWSAYSFHSHDHQPLGTDTLSPADVLRFNDDAFHTYFTNESYLAMIEQKFGPLGVEQIKAMTVKRLPRKLLSDKNQIASIPLALPEIKARKG